MDPKRITLHLVKGVGGRRTAAEVDRVWEVTPGVFAAGAFKPNENVVFKDGSTISLTQYAARRNLQLVTAADFNKMLRGKGCPREATIQKICRAARDEAQVRETVDTFWEKPKEATETLGWLRRDNEDLYRFEEKLEAKENKPRVNNVSN